MAPPAGRPAQLHCNNGASAVNESTPTHDGPKEDLKRSLKSQKISAISLNDMDTSLNSHEITFNISMTEFDHALEEEKKAMFQVTYDESIKKAEKHQVGKTVCRWRFIIYKLNKLRKSLSPNLEQGESKVF